MKFCKQKFLKQVDNFTKRLYSRYLDKMEGKAVEFEDMYGKE